MIENNNKYKELQNAFDYYLHLLLNDPFLDAEVKGSIKISVNVSRLDSWSKPYWLIELVGVESIVIVNENLNTAIEEAIKELRKLIKEKEKQLKKRKEMIKNHERYKKMEQAFKDSVLSPNRNLIDDIKTSIRANLNYLKNRFAYVKDSNDDDSNKIKKISNIIENIQSMNDVFSTLTHDHVFEEEINLISKFDSDVWDCYKEIQDRLLTRSDKWESDNDNENK
jgi:diacylglycerol kinase